MVLKIYFLKLFSEHFPNKTLIFWVKFYFKIKDKKTFILNIFRMHLTVIKKKTFIIFLTLDKNFQVFKKLYVFPRIIVK